MWSECESRSDSVPCFGSAPRRVLRWGSGLAECGDEWPQREDCGV